MAVASRRALPLLAIVPVVAATAVAGTITNPSRTKPCAVEYTKGVRGGPLHLALGPDKKLYATESTADRILRFDPDTHATKEFALPKGTIPHDIQPGPDGNMWFTGLAGRFGRLDIKTGKVTMFAGLAPNSEPHAIAWDRGKAYIAELGVGGLAIFDPATKRFTEVLAGLPPDNKMHSIIALPDGDLWATLSNANKIARFNLREGRFDKFVEMPIRDSGPRDIVYLKRKNALYFSLFAANKFARYDLRTGKVTLYDTPVKPESLAAAQAAAQGQNARNRNAKLTFVKADAKQRYVWSGTFTGELVRLDPDTGDVKNVFCGITFPSGTAGITNDARGRLWFNEAFPGRMGRIEN